MIHAVLDSSAILAVVLEEPGASHVERYLPGANVSAVDIGEVVAKLRDLATPADTASEIVSGLQFDVHDHDFDAAVAAGQL